MDAAAVVGAYHDLWQVEKSFRMAKSDLRARPIFHRERDAIEAHLTVVFAALAVSRHLQDTTGASIKKLIRTLRPLRTAHIDVGGHPPTCTNTDDFRDGPRTAGCRSASPPTPQPTSCERS